MGRICTIQAREREWARRTEVHHIQDTNHPRISIWKKLKRTFICANGDLQSFVGTDMAFVRVMRVAKSFTILSRLLYKQGR